jgi:hypothetical protein
MIAAAAANLRLADRTRDIVRRFFARLTATTAFMKEKVTHHLQGAPPLTLTAVL